MTAVADDRATPVVPGPGPAPHAEPVGARPPGRRRLRLVCGAALAALGVVVVAAGPRLAPYRATALSGLPLLSPSSAHLLGTNALGQDVASQLLLGARVSVLVAVVAGLGTVGLGGLIGVTSGWFGGAVDLVAMRCADLVMVIPKLPLLLLVGALTGGTPITLALLLAATFWPMTARVLRSQVLSLRNRTHVRAAQGFGAGSWHVVRRHILPDLALLMVAELIPAMGRAVTLQAGLAFLGVGSPTQPSWGTIMHDAINYQSLFETSAWTWWLVPPVLAVLVLVVTITLLGTGAEEWLNPRLRRRPRATGRS